MNKQKDSEVNATDVGHHFLTKYYNAMAHDVEQLLHFYSDSSSVKRFGKPTVNGLDNIKTELAKHRQDNLTVRVFNTICLNSLSDSIIIQVSGEFVQKSGEGRAFIQNVILASQGPGKFYIYSDMIEWLSDLYPNLGVQQLSLNDSGHFNGQLGIKDQEPRVRQQSETFADHQQPTLNGQVQSHNYTESHGHQGAPISNIQSFINQAAAQQAQEQAPKVEREPQQPPKQQYHKDDYLDRPTKPEPAQPQTSAPAQSAPLQHAQIPEDTGPRTWAKLVSGQIKSNGLPPPTQPPPASLEQFQSMDKKVKTQQEFQQQQRGEKREGGGYKRDGNFKRKDQDGERREGGGDRNGQRGGDRPFRQRRGGGNREGGNREGGNREGGNREGGNREGGQRGERRERPQNNGDRPFRQQQQPQAART